MSALSIQPTYPIFTETDGLPLENGYIWIGTANLDPQGNPINVYWDAALTIAAPQPIRTLNGYPSRNGTPARLYVNSDYSIRVQNKNGSLVYSAPTATERYNEAVITNVQYVPRGANAVTTTVQDKLHEGISVFDFMTATEVSDVEGSTPILDVAPKIQAALDACFTLGGGIVTAPPGRYRLESRIIIPTNVKLQGLNWLPDIQNNLQTRCTTFQIAWGANQDQHAVEMSNSSSIEGITFFYPDQVSKNVSPPIPFGFTISTPDVVSGIFDNIQVKNISLVNSYKGIRIRNGGRFRIDQVQGEPIYIGITCGNNFDVCYMNGVHFWPFYTGFSPFVPSPDLLGLWKMENATAFEFFRVDQIYVTNCFAYGYNYGFHVRDSAWANFTDILTDTVNYPFRQVTASRVRLENFEFIGSGRVQPAVWWSDGGELMAVNGKIQDSSSVGFQIDGSGGTVLIDNVKFAPRVTSVVVNNTQPVVKISNCQYTIPPFGIGNVAIDGIPLPDPSTAVTLPSPTITPTIITGGYEFDFSTGAVQILQYDFASIVQRNSLYVLSFDYELPVYNPLWYYNIQIQQDVGGLQQVNFGNLYPLMLNTTVAQPTRRMFVPFFANFGQAGQVLNIVITPTAASPGSSLRLTNITLHEQENKLTTDAQVSMMMKQGYNNDAQNMGQTLMAKGKNRIVLTKPEAGIARFTEVPTTGTWAVGDEVRVFNPVSGGFIGYVCIAAGTPGTWVAFGFFNNQTETAANIVSISAAINTTNKYEGKLIWDSTNNRMMRAAGSGANAVWWVVDGSTSVTPV
jgi:hypothetical protein